MGKFNLVTKACAVFLLWAATAVALSTQTFTTLHNFDGTDGDGLLAGLVQAADGNFYGTTAGGGASNVGTIFKITPEGALTTVLSFDGTDGEAPNGLIQSTNGKFYGTTNGEGNSGGTVFRITPGGTLTTLASFDGADGTGPFAGLIQGTDGNFYGTTYNGGAYNNGTVFSITPGGTLTTLHSFCQEVHQMICTDGSIPMAGLVQGTDGNFYGTTSQGGAHSCGNSGYGCGTVFKITPNGTLTTLHSFAGYPTDGDGPYAQVVQGSDGNFYGTATYGGANACYGRGTNGCGTIFQITPSGALTTLHSFDGTDGEFPEAGLIQATDGNFYGTTYDGGVKDGCEYGCGTIFTITPSGTLTTLHEFKPKDGEFPEAGLIQGTDGMFYGTTAGGGTDDDGTVFSLSVSLGPFVETNPVAGKVGAKVGVLGTDLTGATAVTFNGIAAEFKVVSPTLIGAKVPSGATSGTVQVQLPRGTLSSNVPFIVLQ